MQPNISTLTDRFGRVIRDLRISVTPRCNFHCAYCDPLTDSHPEPKGILSVQDVDHFVRASALLGLDSARFTGGEPLLRKELPTMIHNAKNTPGIQDIALTTNGTLFRRRHKELLEAGLNRINISIDALTPSIFRQATGGGDVAVVLDAIDLALELNLHPVKLNAVSMRGINDGELLALAELSLEKPLHVRFIEYMHLNNSDLESYNSAFLSGSTVKTIIEQEFGVLEAVPTDPSSPARVYKVVGSKGSLGFINPISEPFCGACSRMRLTADRRVRPCLLTDRELDASAAFASQNPIEALVNVLLEAAHRKGRMGDLLPKIRERTMVAIGG
ncbi:MAG: GTP 3',8-cyclase MoaA [Deinococcales bacterium]